MCSKSQTTIRRNLNFYISSAQERSPLIHDYKGRKDIETAELERLKAVYMRWRLEVDGDFQFVPVIKKTDGGYQFAWNEQNADNYRGYDLCVKSGELQSYVSWSMPLTGRSRYIVEQARAEANNMLWNNRIQMHERDLEKSVTEQYIICLSDEAERQQADSIEAIMARQTKVIDALVKRGICKLSDQRMLKIERSRNAERSLTAQASFAQHLSELNVLCGLCDTSNVELDGININSPDAQSHALNGSETLTGFIEQYRIDSLQTALTLKASELQYRPQMSLFADGGLCTAQMNTLPKHFGISAGIRFTWVLADGGQRKWLRRQADIQIQTDAYYRTNTINAILERRHRYSNELKSYDERIARSLGQMAEYNKLLGEQEVELKSGLLSMTDYLTALRGKVDLEHELILLKANRLLVLNAFRHEYW